MGIKLEKEKIGTRASWKGSLVCNGGNRERERGKDPETVKGKQEGKKKKTVLNKQQQR